MLERLLRVAGVSGVGFLLGGILGNGDGDDPTRPRKERCGSAIGDKVACGNG